MISLYIYIYIVFRYNRLLVYLYLMCKPLGAQSIFSLSSCPQQWRFFLKKFFFLKKAITFSATHCSAFHKWEWAMSKATIRPSSEPRLCNTVIFLSICMHSFKLASERPYVSQHIRKRDRVSCSQSLCCSIFVSDWSAGAFYLFIYFSFRSYPLPTGALFSSLCNAESRHSVILWFPHSQSL